MTRLSSGLATMLIAAGLLSSCTSSHQPPYQAVAPAPTTSLASPAPTASRPSAEQVQAGTVPTRHSDALPNADGSCAGAQLQGLYAGGVVPFTGEHSAFVNVFNISRRTCTLRGSLEVHLLHDGVTLPFRVVRGGRYVESQGTTTVISHTLLPGTAVHVLTAAYRCDSGELSIVNRLRLHFSGDPGRIDVLLPASYPGYYYCQGYNGTPDSRDPGNVLEVGPVVAGVAHGT